MANLFARASANWSSANWNTAADGSGSSATPGAGDVCMANAFSVTVNADTTVAEVRNDTTGGAQAGGTFTLSNGVTLTANVHAGGVANACVTFAGASPNVAYVVGNSTAGSIGSAHGTQNTNSGTLTITGNVTGPSAGSTAYGAANTNTGRINITGNAISGITAYGAYNQTTGTVAITGNATATGAGGHGAYNGGAGTLTISGYVQGSDYGPGSTGVSSGYGAINGLQGVLEIGETKCGAKGFPGVSGAFRYASATAAKSTVRATSGLTEVALRPIAAVVPAVTDVKAEVVYGDSGYTGTLVATSGNSMEGHFS